LKKRANRRGYQRQLLLASDWPKIPETETATNNINISNQNVSTGNPPVFILHHSALEGN
jgi:hypothetical protein